MLLYGPYACLHTFDSTLLCISSTQTQSLRLGAIDSMILKHRCDHCGGSASKNENVGENADFMMQSEPFPSG